MFTQEVDHEAYEGGYYSRSPEEALIEVEEEEGISIFLLHDAWALTH